MNQDKLIRQAKKLLIDIGMDAERSNERSALTLLALAHMDENTTWMDATGEMYTTREIMDWIRDRLGIEYAANTRETIRRFTLHQFIAGGAVDYNADDPNRATNSPKSNYRITPKLLDVIRVIGTERYEYSIVDFRDHIETWKSQQHESRGMNKIPVSMPNGSICNLSAGGQNVLIKSIIEEFCSRYTPGAEIIYIDDTNKKQSKSAGHEALDRFKIEIPDHGKAPDLIVWVQAKEWLFLIEACSTHGPIDVIRKRDLEKLFAGAKGHIVFVSCFPDRATMRKYLADLAWETEAWCADNPDHMIHMDGEKFLGPH